MFFKVILLAYPALLTMINPPIAATLLLSLAKGKDNHYLQRQADMAGVFLFVALCMVFFVGASILHVFGISMPGLRLAGGIIIGFIGFRMLFPPPVVEHTMQDDANIAFVPLTIPNMCGPGTMALVISGASQVASLPETDSRLPIYGGVIAAFLLISLTSWIILRMAQPINSFLGRTGIDALTRIMGFLLISLGMQFMINGVKGILADPAFRAVLS